MKYYDNFEALQNEHPAVATELLDKKGGGDWQEDTLYYYDDPGDFAECEVCDGWYKAILGKDISQNIYNGAPNLYDFVDIDALGIALTSNWDESSYFISSFKAIVVTDFGW